jgi:hypothetical protein
MSVFTPHALSAMHLPSKPARGRPAVAGAIALVRGPGGATLAVGGAVEATAPDAMEEARRIAREAAGVLNAGIASYEWNAFVRAHDRVLSPPEQARDAVARGATLARAREVLLETIATAPRSR